MMESPGRGGLCGGIAPWMKRVWWCRSRRFIHWRKPRRRTSGLKRDVSPAESPCEFVKEILTRLMAGLKSEKYFMKTVSMKSVSLPSGERVPAFGLGTWHFGDNPAIRAEEIATLQLGLDLGATLIDTAEMYG